jgi:proton-dependent oligopeptide transporter, POT family
MSAKYRTTPIQTSEMPPGVPFIIGNEAAERFSYYGMSGILFAFLTEHLRDINGSISPISEHHANEWTH